MQDMCLQFLATLDISASAQELCFIHLLYHQSKQAQSSLTNVGDPTQLFWAAASLFLGG